MFLRSIFSWTNIMASECFIVSIARFGPMARPAWLNARSSMADEPGMLKQWRASIAMFVPTRPHFSWAAHHFNGHSFRSATSRCRYSCSHKSNCFSKKKGRPRAPGTYSVTQNASKCFHHRFRHLNSILKSSLLLWAKAADTGKHA